MRRKGFSSQKSALVQARTRVGKSLGSEESQAVVASVIEVVEDGYEFFSGRKLVTIFSAPNYCNEFDNAGGMMVIDANLHCSFRVLLPQDRKRK